MYAELEQKICPQCGDTKEKKEFGKDITTPTGVSSWCKPCKKKWRSQLRKDNPEEHKRIDFKNDLKKYGLTTEDYNRMFKNQNGCCDCCGQTSENFRRGLHVDHDHTTGQVRALLCTQCNPGLGYFKDSVERLEMAIKYLKKFKK
jgi:Recombination endonuclease VII